MENTRHRPSLPRSNGSTALADISNTHSFKQPPPVSKSKRVLEAAEGVPSTHGPTTSRKEARSHHAWSATSHPTDSDGPTQQQRAHYQRGNALDWSRQARELAEDRRRREEQEEMERLQEQLLAAEWKRLEEEAEQRRQEEEKAEQEAAQAEYERLQEEIFQQGDSQTADMDVPHIRTQEENDRRVQMSLAVPQVGTFTTSETCGKIFCNLKNSEGLSKVKENYMETVQASLPENSRVLPQMRTILVVWLSDICSKFRLSDETLFRTINFVDRFLSKQPIPSRSLQLLGLSALLVASKCAEMDDMVPRVWELCELCERAYQAEEIVAFERTLLAALNYHLNVPTAREMLELLHSKINAPSHVVNLSYYLCELGLTQYRVSRYLPSHLASAALYLASVSVRSNNPWPAELEALTNYRPINLWEAVLDIHAIWWRCMVDHRVTGVVEKYSTLEFHEASSQQLFPVPIIQ